MATVMKEIIVLFCLARICISQWDQSELILPREEVKQAPGIYNNSIYLLGGELIMQQLVEYLILEDRFIDYGVPYGSEDVTGSGQYYTQIDHILYIKDSISDTIAIFNMKTNTFTPNYITNIPSTQGRHSCVASTQTQLFILGGAATANGCIPDVNLYNLSANEWLSNIPQMQESRCDFACIIHPATNVLYVIAGVTTSGITSSVEIIEVSDIQSKDWQFIDPLSEEIAWTRCVLYKNTIYVIGGADEYATYPYYTATNKVHTINVVTNEVALFPDRMPLMISDVAPIVVGHILYVFGGWNEVNLQLNNVMMYDFDPQNKGSTSSPTEAPTAQLTTSDAPIAQLTSSEAPIAQLTSSEAPSTDFTVWTSTNTLQSSVILTTTSNAPTSTNINAVMTPSLTRIDSSTVTVTSTMLSNVQSQDGISHEDKLAEMIIIGIIASIFIIFLLLFLIMCIFKKYLYVQKEERENNIAGEMKRGVPPNNIERVIDAVEDHDSDSSSDSSDGSDGLWQYDKKKITTTTTKTKRGEVLNEIEGQKKVAANNDNMPYTYEGAQEPNIC